MNTKTILWIDGKRRLVVETFCQHCSTSVWVPKHRLTRTKFCSRECSNAHKSKTVLTPCSLCSKETLKSGKNRKRSKTGLLFCSRKCKDTAQSLTSSFTELRPAHYGDGRHTYRKRALDALGAVCRKCGYDRISNMLDVHHVDGDHANGKLLNLRVLCVWCHAAETRGVTDIRR